MSQPAEHYDDVAFQVYLEGDLHREVRAAMEAHLATCVRCSSLLEGWHHLLEELEDLHALEPSEELQNVVLERIAPDAPVRRSLRSRLARAISFGPRHAPAHPSPELVQGVIEGGVRGRRARHLRAHLAACPECEGEYERWKNLFGALAGLDRPAAPSGFADSVMRQVEIAPDRVGSPATDVGVTKWGSAASRLRDAARVIVPSTRRGWAVASAIVAAPALGIATIFGLVVIHPLLTVWDLLAFVTWRTGDLVSWIVQRAADSPLLLEGYTFAQALASSPGLTLGAVLAIWSTSIGAGWIVYRNVVAPSRMASRHG